MTGVPAIAAVTTPAFDAPPPSLSSGPAVSGPANVTVIVPDGAQVWFDGNLNSQTGPKREFTSAALEPGQSSTLAIKVTPPGGSPQTMQLPIRAGDKTTVDLSR